MKRPFNKTALTYQQQIELLEIRGMIINDHDKARFYLQQLNYYRLRGYWLPFEIRGATSPTENSTPHQFQPGTTFEMVLNLYVFDRELRLLVLDAIERIEVSVRSVWAYQLAHLHGPHAHLDATLASDQKEWQKNFQTLRRQVKDSKETFIEHMRDTYQEQLPAIWACCEVMSLGLLSRWYKYLRPAKTRKEISRTYDPHLHDEVFESWLHHLNIIRNICAHHKRLWNREFVGTPVLPKTRPQIIIGEFVSNSRKLYNSLVIIVYLLDRISPGHTWRTRLKRLIRRHKVPTASMDFPKNWKRRAIWQEATP